MGLERYITLSKYIYCGDLFCPWNVLFTDGMGWMDGMERWMDWWTGYEKCLLIFFNLRYIKRYTNIHLNILGYTYIYIYIKVVRTNFVGVLNFDQVGGPDAKSQKYPLGWIFFNRTKRRSSNFCELMRPFYDKFTIFLYFWVNSFLERFFS